MDIPRMTNQAWRQRLEAAIERAGKSKREVSLAAGKGAGYVHSILSEGKDPTIDNLTAVCDAVPVSVFHVLLGADMSPDDVEILQAIQENPSVRAGILSILRAQQDA